MSKPTFEGLLSLAESSCLSGDFAPAVATYLHLISTLSKSDHLLCDGVKQKFLSTLSDWSRQNCLSDEDRSLLKKAFTRGVQLANDDELFMNDIGQLLLE